MTYEKSRSDVAVFIDFENVYVSVRDKLDANPNFEVIMDRCSDLGRVVLARAYADWYRYPRITSALYANAIEPIYVATYFYDKDVGRTGRAIKNSVDMHLCIDAMKTLYTSPHIAKFVLVTGDRDFIPLVNSIRQQGKEVIVVGIGGAASTHLAQSADEFIFYEQLIGRVPGQAVRGRQPAAALPERVVELPIDEPEVLEVPLPSLPAVPTPTPAEFDIYQVLVEAIQLVRKRGYVSTLGSIKLVMKELMGGDFKESRYKDLNGRPFAKFKDFVVDAEKRGKVQIFTNGTVNEVFLPGEDPYKLSQFASELEKAAEEAVGNGAVSNGKEPLAGAVAETSHLGASPAGRRRRRRSRGRGAAHHVAESPLELQDLEPEELPELDELPEFEEPGEPLTIDMDELLALAALGEPDEVYSLMEEQFSEDMAAAALPDEIAAAVEAMLAAGYESIDVEIPLGPEGLIEEGPEFELPLAEQAPVGEAVFEGAPEAPVGEESAEALEEAESDEDGALDELVFSNEEWVLFHGVMAGFTKPVSFQQIFDTLRGLRKDQQLVRTNEQLRTMVKQAINSGILERSGRGKRIYYQLGAGEQAPVQSVDQQ